MAQDDQTQKCSSSGGGGGGGGGGIGSVNGRSLSSKKPKQKKVPQRGLGVAQLEKIRLEEQQKKDAAVVAAAAILSSSPSPLSPPTKSSYISVPIPHYHHSNQSSSSIPFPSLPSVDTSSANSIFRPSLPAQNVDVMKPNTVPLTNLAHNDGYEISGLANVPKLLIPREYNFEKENSSGLDPGLALRSTLNLPYEPNTIWPLTVPVHRTQQHHQTPSMVNIPLSTSSSSVLSFQMEPPSNQSYYGNRTPMWPEEEKIIGMKRPYPFSLENPPGPPSFNFKFPTFVGPVRVDGPASCGINGSSFTLEPRNTKLREGPSCSTSNSELHSRNGIRENGAANGDFLTLALPTWTCTQIPKFNLPPAHLSFHNRESPNLETLHFKGSVNEPKKKLQAGPSGSSEQAPPFYSFFPPANLQIGQAETTMNNCNGEVGENVDLNLKL